MRLKVSLVTALALAVGLMEVPVASAEPHCAKGWRFTQMKKKRTRMIVHERRRVENDTNGKATVTFSSKRSKTVTMRASVSVEAGYNAIFASVKATVDAGVERSVTAEVGEQVSYTVPAHRSAVGNYGVFIRPVRGRLTHGTRSNSCLFDKRVTAYLPRQSGWRIKLVKR